MGARRSAMQPFGPDSATRTAKESISRRTSGKGQKRKDEVQQRLNLSAVQSEGDPPLSFHGEKGVALCHAATKHAIPSTMSDVPHQPQLGDNAPTNTDPQRNTHGTNGSIVEKSTEAQSNPHRLKLSFPRKPKSRGKGITRKQLTLHLKTEVDWNEDLHPTDEEILPPDYINDDEGTVVSTPDPELTYEEESEVDTRYKRKGLAVRQTPRKRRKSIQAKKNSATKKKRPSQLPLTTLAVDDAAPGQSEETAPRANANSNPQERCRSSNKRRSCTDRPLSLNLQSQNERKDQQTEIIEISSASVSPSSSSPDNGINGLRSEAYRYRVIGTGSDGRGKAVGQKLVDALRGVELHTQLRPAIETTLLSTHRTLNGTHHAESYSSRSHILTSSRSQSQFSLASHDATVKGHIKTETTKQTQSSQEPLQLTQLTKLPVELANSPNNAYEALSDLAKMEEYLDGGDNTGMQERDNGERQQGHLSESPEKVVPGEYSQQDISQPHDLAVNERGSSSKSSAGLAIERDANTPFQSKESGNNVTPESQRPLLTQKTPIHANVSLANIVKTAPKSSIVDSNGSPRLVKEAHPMADKLSFELVQIPKIAQTLPSSSSDYDQNSVKSSTNSSVDEMAWSKYQRDMFLEYGFETASMKNTQYIQVKDSPTNDYSNKTPCFKDAKELSTKSPPAMPKTLPSAGMPTGLDDCGVHPKRNSMFASNFHVGEPETPGKNTDQHAVVPLATEIPGVFLAASESQQLSQPSGCNPLDWALALQGAQRSAHDLLLETNQHLSSQLAAEQETIRQMLQIYRQGCNHILDDLFQAQRTRMSLYQQQMTTVKEQHREICQDLIRGLQELDHRVQEGPERGMAGDSGGEGERNQFRAS